MKAASVPQLCFSICLILKKHRIWERRGSDMLCTQVIVWIMQQLRALKVCVPFALAAVKLPSSCQAGESRLLA